MSSARGASREGDGQRKAGGSAVCLLRQVVAAVWTFQLCPRPRTRGGPGTKIKFGLCGETTDRAGELEGPKVEI